MVVESFQAGEQAGEKRWSVLSGLLKSLPPHEAAVGNPETPLAFASLLKQKKTVDGFSRSN